jgi:hypothetical protein
LSEPATGFEGRAGDTASAHPVAPSASDAEHLASCSAPLYRKWPDLALLVERWAALPEAGRAGIVAMVWAAGG